MTDSLPAVHANTDIPSDVDDVDLNSLALFHSSAPSKPFSSQSTTAAATSFLPDSQASEAVVWDGPALLSTKKPRRHRDRQAPSSGITVSPVEPTSRKEKHKLKRPRSGKIDHETPDSYHQSAVASCLDQPLLSMPSAGANIVPFPDPAQDRASGIGDGKMDSLAVSKKRKHQDSTTCGSSKKRRSRHEAHPREQEAQEDIFTLTPPADFTQSGRDKGPASNDDAAEEARANMTSPNDSPTATHIEHHSLSRPVDLQENSLSRPESDHSQVNIGADTGETEKRINFADVDVKALARESLADHRNDQSTPAKSQSPAGSPAASNLKEADPSPVIRTRPTRKKANPSFFDTPETHVPVNAEDSNREALQELPPPEAMTPKPRKRAKVAARKTAKGKKPKLERLPLPTRLEEVENLEEEELASRPVRRNRLAGFTQGRFTDEELARIARAVEDFRAQHDLTQQEVNHMIHAPGGTTAGDDHAQLWSRVFAECPSRQRQKIINITRKKFHNFVARATWTAEQDAELSELVLVHGRQWSKIAAIVNRHPEDLRDRYRNYLVCGQNQRKDTWDDDEELRLTQEVIIAMRDVDELRRQPDKSHLLNCSYELIDWQLISEKMNRTRSRLQCITKWKSLNFRTHGKDSLVSSQPDANISFRLEKARRQIAAIPDEEKFRLILAIQATGVGKDSKIPWQRLVDKKFRNQWHRSTQMLLWRRLRQGIPGLEAKTTRDAALILVQQYNNSGKLPEVDGDGFDEALEMEFIQSLPASFSGVNTTAMADQGKSAEHVVDSEADEPQTEANEPAAEAAIVDDIEIDPALTEAPVAPVAVKKPTTARKTGSGRPPSKKKAKIAPMALMDPIEDDDNLAGSGADNDDITDATQT